VLIAESRVTPTYTSSHCTVAKGKWYSYYDGATWTNPADVDIDHLVALAEAWGSGARLWSVTNRTRYANDLGFAASLVAVTDNVNMSKSAKDPAEWLPPRIARPVHVCHPVGAGEVPLAVEHRSDGVHRPLLDPFRNLRSPRRHSPSPRHLTARAHVLEAALYCS